MSTALLLGATGLVGSQLLAQLLEHPRFDRVLSFGRRKTGQVHPRLEEHVVDLGAPASWSGLVKGDLAFSALGTTLKQAGSQAAQKKVDLDYQLDFARAAAGNGVLAYALVSSASADPDSRLFYVRLKGELDREVQRLGFERVRIMRPSLLGGDRARSRPMEKVSSVLLGALTGLGIARRYREIQGSVVARAMINAALDPARGTRIFTYDEIFAEADRGVAP
jgi:uncharacterized protein YbjT (DUF2867 family)